LRATPGHGALAVLLSALAVAKIARGMALVAVFSLGMASVLVATGLMFIKGSDLLRQRLAGNTWAKNIGLASALLITVVGLGLTAKAMSVLF